MQYMETFYLDLLLQLARYVALLEDGVGQAMFIQEEMEALEEDAHKYIFLLVGYKECLAEKMDLMEALLPMQKVELAKAQQLVILVKAPELSMPVEEVDSIESKQDLQALILEMEEVLLLL